MIHPDMATMLGYLTTDAAITRTALQTSAHIRRSMTSFNCIYGRRRYQHQRHGPLSGQWPGRQSPSLRKADAGFPPIRATLNSRPVSTLALAICRDGEGVTKVVKIEVNGAQHRGRREAGGATDRRRPTLSKPPCSEKTPTGDASWRAIGAPGVTVEPTKIRCPSIRKVPWSGRQSALDLPAERRIAQGLSTEEFTIQVDLGPGHGPCHHVDHRLVL